MILPGARRALELLVQAGGELVLLGPGWHTVPVEPWHHSQRWQGLWGPCWVPLDRGPGRRPRAVEPVSGDEAQWMILNGWAEQPRDDRLLVTAAGRQAHEQPAQPPSTLDDLECGRCGGWIGVPGGCICEAAPGGDEGALGGSGHPGEG